LTEVTLDRAAMLTDLVARARLEQTQAQVLRLPPVYFAIDVFVVWIVSGVGLLRWGLVWMALNTALYMARWVFVKAQQRRPVTDAARALVHLSFFYVTQGIWRSVLTVVLFQFPVAEPHFLYTMVVAGLAAGGISSVGSLARTYVLWAAAVGIPLAAVWMSQGPGLPVGFGLLTITMMALLSLFVRDQGRAQAELVAAAFENEQLAESLRVERDKANAANQSKTRFFAAASHDLRQPLHALSINATTLELVARRQSDPVVKELSQSINRALRQSNSLLDGLLDISRLDANAVELQLEAVEVSAMLESIRAEFSPVAAQAGLTLTVQTAAHGDHWMHTDSDLMTRVLSNLVSNALKFTAAGGVSLSAVVDGSAVRISIADTGVGIPASEQEKVFEEFYQIGNASRDRTMGLGLGLSIVKRATELLNVPMKLESGTGHGTRVELRVPLTNLRPTSSTKSTGTEVAPDVLTGKRVLVIDDEEEILQALAGLLPHLGCEVRVATGSEQALTAVAGGFKPDALLVDHRLRNESGPEVIALLRLQLPGVPAVLVTGDTAPQQMRLLQDSGFEVIHKPVDGQHLAQALSDALRH
jgi:signal transduction histidine kinase